jgi:hypothetical protein
VVPTPSVHGATGHALDHGLWVRTNQTPPRPRTRWPHRSTLSVATVRTSQATVLGAVHGADLRSLSRVCCDVPKGLVVGNEVFCCSLRLRRYRPALDDLAPSLDDLAPSEGCSSGATVVHDVRRKTRSGKRDHPGGYLGQCSLLQGVATTAPDDGIT